MHRATTAGIPQSSRLAALGPLEGNGWSSGMAQSQSLRRRGRPRIETPNPNAVHLSASIRNMVYWYLVEHSIYCGCVPCLNSIAPNPTDIQVGARLRLRRKMIGLSQER